MPVSIQRCAREYGAYWFSKERELVAAVSSDDGARRLQGLQHAAGYFRVARTMRTAFDTGRGRKRLAPALAVLQQAPFRTVTSANLTDVVSSLRHRLGRAYGDTDLLSAATKLLWLFHRGSVVIFDSQVRTTLGTPNGDYEQYVSSWRREFSKVEGRIRQVCSGLEATSFSLACAVRPSPSQVREAARGRWFRMRVFDLHLWHLGAR